MRSSHFRLRLCALAAVGGLLLAGCSTGSPQTDAASFLNERATAMTSLASTTRALDAEISRLTGSPTPAQLAQIGRAAGEAHDAALKDSEWNVPGAGEEGAEEEDVPRAGTQVTEGAGELAQAMSYLKSYAKAPETAALRHYKGKLANARTEWNEGVAQLWYLAHRSHAPII